MPALKIVIAPNPILKEKAAPVLEFGAELQSLCADMLDTIYFEHAVGIGANMVGILKRIAIIDMQADGIKAPYIFVNPVITEKSSEMQTHSEASICFPGIFANIKRHRAITVCYQDQFGEHHTINAEGPFATVIQHEIDYLDGKVFLDYLEPAKRSFLLQKMRKFIADHPPHIHSASCKH